jgi:hypothetical protein
MESFPVDIEPAQVVRWIKAEHERAPSTFRIAARRRREIRRIPDRRDLHLGDEEREDLNEVATIATLEVGPAHAADGWLLRIVVEDEIGPRISEDGTASAAEQGIDIDAFYHEFILPGRGNANITGKVEGLQARDRLARLLQTIETDGRHTERVASKRA